MTIILEQSKRTNNAGKRGDPCIPASFLERYDSLTTRTSPIMRIEP